MKEEVEDEDEPEDTAPDNKAISRISVRLLYRRKVVIGGLF